MSTHHSTGITADQSTDEFCSALAAQLRVDSIRLAALAGSGHPTSSMSAADLMAVLFARHLHADLVETTHPGNDRLIFSKGHASPLYYALLRAAGVIDAQEFETYRQLGSRLEGHPTPRLPQVEVATGSLGQGLPIGVGMAIAGKLLDRVPYRVWVLCGDSEMAEGSMWEAFQHAGWRRLDNLTAIIDVNRLGQTRETMLGWDADGYAERIGAFGWHTVVIDGHDLPAVDAALTEAETTAGRPTAIIARTVKGRGASEVEDLPGKHGKPLQDPDRAIAELGGERDLRVQVAGPRDDSSPHRFAAQPIDRPSWSPGDQVATRTAYGQALAWLASLRGDVLALDGEVSNSTHAADVATVDPDRYLEMFIAEQQMVGAAVGLAARGWSPFASTFGSFWSRAYDFIRMAAISRADLRLCGSHAGVSIGADGPSQMALEDIAEFRAIHATVVLQPSDANQVTPLLFQLADRKGISYLRTLRGKTTVRTSVDEDIRIGGSRSVRIGDRDQVTVIASGITVGEAVKAADLAAQDGIRVRVIDAYSIKPLDGDAVRRAGIETGALITVEDHRPEGGLGDAVCEALEALEAPAPVLRLAVRNLPTSGTPEEQLHAARIDAESIHQAIRERVGGAA